ncbi:uncharacterized protein [Diadema antillarum]|uniref:uncharacterized protein n=1 Tax=Diadema antillarum TaxID=105358 RepID=UPI003A87F94E
MECTADGYLIPNGDQVFNGHSERSVLNSNAHILSISSPHEPLDHHYEHLDPSKSKKKKGRPWNIFSSAKRRSRSLGPSVGRMMRRTVMTSELDFEKHSSVLRSQTMKHKVKDIVIVGSEPLDAKDRQEWSYRQRKMSSPLPSPVSQDSPRHSVLSDGQWRDPPSSPLNRIPSVGSHAAASLPGRYTQQPALPPRRYSEMPTMPSGRPLSDSAFSFHSLSELNGSSAVVDDELQLLRHRVEVLERRLAGELDTEDFKVLLDIGGESSTDDPTEDEVFNKQSVPTVRAGTTRRSGSADRRVSFCESSTLPEGGLASRKSRHADWISKQSSSRFQKIDRSAIEPSPEVVSDNSYSNHIQVGREVSNARRASLPVHRVIAEEVSAESKDTVQRKYSQPSIDIQMRVEKSSTSRNGEDRANLLKEPESNKVNQTTDQFDDGMSVLSRQSDCLILLPPGESTTDDLSADELDNNDDEHDADESAGGDAAHKSAESDCAFVDDGASQGLLH